MQRTEQDPSLFPSLSTQAALADLLLFFLSDCQTNLSRNWGVVHSWQMLSGFLARFLSSLAEKFLLLENYFIFLQIEAPQTSSKCPRVCGALGQPRLDIFALVICKPVSASRSAELLNTTSAWSPKKMKDASNENLNWPFLAPVVIFLSTLLDFSVYLYCRLLSLNASNTNSILTKWTSWVDLSSSVALDSTFF